MGRGTSKAGGAKGGASRSPLTNGEPQTVSTYYNKKAMFGSRFVDEALDASFDASAGVLSLGYAENKEWGKQNVNRAYVDITVKNGIINGKPVNVDIGSSSIKAVSTTANLSSKTENLLRNNGFEYNSADKQWQKNYVGYAKKGNTLYADTKLPSDLSGITQVKTKYGAVDTKPLKQAGFKWSPNDKVWKK